MKKIIYIVIFFMLLSIFAFAEDIKKEDIRVYINRIEQDIQKAQQDLQRIIQREKQLTNIIIYKQGALEELKMVLDEANKKEELAEPKPEEKPIEQASENKEQ